MIEKLIVLNEKLIKMNYDKPDELNKQIIIKKILLEENCFLKMDIETAYSILRDLKIPECDIKKIYFQLI